ncbi:hypothetical protein HDU96_007209 [Phlyctochytrium bullatum]|nr:hypothetical protein HDU96_007209 [Phlyctochytrium bullatum]
MHPSPWTPARSWAAAAVAKAREAQALLARAAFAAASTASTTDAFNVTDALNGSATDDGSYGNGGSEPEGWFTSISIKFITWLNACSMALMVFSIIIFLVCRWLNPKFFERVSLRLVFSFFVMCIGFHAAFIYSLYLTDSLNCKISTFMYTFCSLVHCLLTTGLGVNLFIIFVMKRGVPDWAFGTYWIVSVIVAMAFCLPPMFMNNVISFNELDGCWFDQPQTTWQFYYGPLFLMALVNIVLAICVWIALGQHVETIESERRVTTANDVSEYSTARPHTPHHLDHPTSPSPQPYVPPPPGTLKRSPLSHSDVWSKPLTGAGGDPTSPSPYPPRTTSALDSSRPSLDPPVGGRYPAPITTGLRAGGHSLDTPPSAPPPLVTRPLSPPLHSAGGSVASPVTQLVHARSPTPSGWGGGGALGSYPPSGGGKPSYEVAEEGRDKRNRKKKRKTEDELRAIALCVTLYCAIPFICEVPTAILETIPGNGGETGSFFMTVFVSSMGLLTFVVMLFDPSVHRSFKTAVRRTRGGEE